MLEKLEILEVDEEDTSALRLKFPPSPRSGTYPVIIENVAKTYGDHTVFRNANLMIERGDKIAFRRKEWRRKVHAGEMYHERDRTRRHADHRT